ncbi:hypothetical protein BCR34DRAFT_575285 [Clohesyomyces aquaticus]|uniref:Uncharacterized protein n=1 Tax=Clohesyomyces aquaticus TaxID=1231657 RepID=A0A1Y1YSF4_9PLEO|nr:hypothetical protein BCR34DRAFT_575285 [Clohesyomyces aquaticus]
MSYLSPPASSIFRASLPLPSVPRPASTSAIGFMSVHRNYATGPAPHGMPNPPHCSCPLPNSVFVHSMPLLRGSRIPSHRSGLHVHQVLQGIVCLVRRNFRPLQNAPGWPNILIMFSIPTHPNQTCPAPTVRMSLRYSTTSVFKRTSATLVGESCNRRRAGLWFAAQRFPGCSLVQRVFKAVIHRTIYKHAPASPIDQHCTLSSASARLDPIVRTALCRVVSSIQSLSHDPCRLRLATRVYFWLRRGDTFTFRLSRCSHW